MLSFFVRYQGVTIEATTIIIVLTIALLLWRDHPPWFHTAEHGLSWLARRRKLSVTLIILLVLGASATPSWFGRLPEPRVHDEFSYLLAGDTFARGRLTNSTHPMWVHFESFQIIQQPSYASKYPPAQGLMLAIGKLISGHPIVGVWIATALACASIYWMLLAWLPLHWALLGALLVALHPGMLLTWGQNYWGGAVAATGGALVFGALRRIIGQPRVRDALLLGVGVAILANSRPYEGLVTSLPVAVVLLAELLRRNGLAIGGMIKRVALPILIVLIPTAGAMGFYNWRITGDALRLPYLVYQQTYAVVPIFIWQAARPEPPYRHEIMRDFYSQMLNRYETRRTVPGFMRASVRKIKRLWRFYQGDSPVRLALTVPLIMMPWVLRNRWPRFALFTIGIVMVGLLLEMYEFPHYGAPMTGVVFMLLLQAWRQLYRWRWHGRALGQLLAWTLFMTAMGSFIVTIVQQLGAQSDGWEVNRAQIVRQLKEDQRHHLVIVRYGPRHSPHYEWVYNEADIDGAKIVWARELTGTENSKLLEYFKDREVWLAEVNDDRVPPKLLAYPRVPH